MNQTFMGAYADGAPPVAPPRPTPTYQGSPSPYTITSPYSIPTEYEHAPEGIVARTTRAASRIRTFEGPRGYATRGALIAKNVSAFCGLLACIALTHWCFSAIPTWRFGGMVMLYAVALMFAVCFVGTVLYADSRHEIARQCRHFTYGITVLPGTALAIFMRVVHSALAGSASDDMFVSLLRGNALPLVYFSVAVIPAFVYAKYVFGGIRSANRSALNDEELLATYMRQDGWQR